MGDDDDRDAKPPVDVPDQLQDGMGRLRIQGAGGLVAEQDLRVRRQGSGDGDPLLLAAGQLGRVGVRLIRQAHDLQKLHGPLFRVCLVHARQLQGETDIFQAGALHQKVEALENHRNLPADLSKLGHRQRSDILPVDQHLALRGPLQHINAADQRTLARPAHTDDSVNISVLNGQVHAFERFHRAVSRLKLLGQISNLYHNFLRIKRRRKPVLRRLSCVLCSFYFPSVMASREVCFPP